MKDLGTRLGELSGTVPDTLVCSDHSDFSEKSGAMCQIFDKSGYLVSVVHAGYHHAQRIDLQSALQAAEKENTSRIPFTLTFHPHNHAVKSIILNLKCKLLQNDSETGAIFSQSPVISFKRDENIGNFLVRSSFQTNDQPGTFKCARSRCKTCPFIHNVGKISGPKRSIKISYVHLSQCHLLHNLHSLQKVIH